MSYPVGSLPLMSRSATHYRCEECGAASARWVGRCSACGAWGALSEAARVVAAVPATGLGGNQPMPIGQVPVGEAHARPTGVPELDRVLGGGLVPGSVTLL